MSFKEVYEKYYPGLVRFGLQLYVNRVDAEDLAQETFLRYHVAISKDLILENTRAWLYRVMLNQAITRKSTRSLHDARIKSSQAAQSQISEEEAHARKERRELVFQVLEQLPVKDKNLLLLCNKTPFHFLSRQPCLFHFPYFQKNMVYYILYKIPVDQ